MGVLPAVPGAGISCFQVSGLPSFGGNLRRTSAGNGFTSGLSRGTVKRSHLALNYRLLSCSVLSTFFVFAPVFVLSGSPRPGPTRPVLIFAKLAGCLCHFHTSLRLGDVTMKDGWKTHSYGPSTNSVSIQKRQQLQDYGPSNIISFFRIRVTRACRGV